MRRTTMTPVTDEQLQRFRVECTDCNQTGTVVDCADTPYGDSIEIRTQCYSCDGDGVYWMEYYVCSEGHQVWKRSTDKCPKCFEEALEFLRQLAPF